MAVNNQALRFDGFKENVALRTEANTVAVVVQPIIDPGFIVEIYTSDQPGTRLALMETCLRSIATEQNSYQICGFYLSAILCIIPHLKPVVLDTLASMGATVTENSTAASYADAGLVLGNPLPISVALTYLGQLIFIPFKYIQAVSYAVFMTKRTQAFRSLAGVPTDAQINICVELEKAKIINSVLGNKYRFRKAIVEVVMASAGVDSTYSDLFVNIRTILGWTEMSSVVLVQEAIFLPRSPVLNVLKVQTEVKNAAIAITQVYSSTHPQFFKIFASPSDAVVISKMKFPTLVALAKQILSVNSPTVGQFVGTAAGVNDDLVTELLGIHNNYMRNRRMVAAPVLRNLFGPDDHIVFQTVVEGEPQPEGNAA